MSNSLLYVHISEMCVIRHLVNSFVCVCECVCMRIKFKGEGTLMDLGEPGQKVI